jgi:hypothetical protein
MLTIAAAAAVLVLALVTPTLRDRSFTTTLDSAFADVESLSAAARGAFEDTGSWPGASTLGREAYVVDWTTLNVVEEIEVAITGLPPEALAAAQAASLTTERVPTVASVGALVLHSSDLSLLAELLARYGEDESFVRDSTWTLVVLP